MRTGQNQAESLERRGAALLVALVCASIAVAVMYGIVQLASQSHREVGLEQRQLQACWIAESAADRAAAQLAADGAYVGERWTIPAGELDGRYDAAVQIEVKRVDGDADRCRIRVVADYPPELPYRVRETRVFWMPAASVK